MAVESEWFKNACTADNLTFLTKKIPGNSGIFFGGLDRRLHAVGNFDSQQ